MNHPALKTLSPGGAVDEGVDIVVCGTRGGLEARLRKLRVICPL